MKASELDRKFDNNEDDILHAFDREQLKRPHLAQKRVNVDFPCWMVESLDGEARRLGVTRQSLIKMWLADRLNTV